MRLDQRRERVPVTFARPLEQLVRHSSPPSSFSSYWFRHRGSPELIDPAATSSRLHRRLSPVQAP
jgi:hypothetical protein